jgi:hypothetical protein
MNAEEIQDQSGNEVVGSAQYNEKACLTSLECCHRGSAFWILSFNCLHTGRISIVAAEGGRRIDDQTALANGEKLTLSDGSGNTMMIESVANFPNYTPNPLPTFMANVRGSTLRANPSVVFSTSGSGQVLRFETTADTPTLVADCMSRPTSMAFDEKTGRLYVTEVGGRVLAVGIP